MITVSVIMATYNGEKYIEEQLYSILNQSRVPDEVIILDDCSNDRTISIVKEFIRVNKLKRWKLIENSVNKGWRKNFIDGFHLTKSDIIFCADQDDIWLENKIEIMTDTMLNNENIDVLACNLKPMYYPNSLKVSSMYTKNYGKSFLESVDFYKVGLTGLRPGCTMCFRSNLIKQIDCIWTPELSHDGVLWSIGLITKSIYIINKELIVFRRHSSNSTPLNVRNRVERIKNLENEGLMLYRTMVLSSENNADYKIRKYLKKLYKFNALRIRMLKYRKLSDIIKLIININLYYSPKNFVGDLISSLR